jgi:hypothetical protein
MYLMYIVMFTCAMAPTKIVFVYCLLRMGKRCPKHVEVLSFNKVKVIVKCMKLVRVIKLYHDARSTKH